MNARNHRAAHRRGGFMLLEMLGALILLTAFALVASRLFTISMRVLYHAPPAQHELVSFDAMLAVLRDDAWSGRDVVAPDERTLTIASPGGAITWTIATDGSVVRAVRGSGDAEPRTWLGVGERIRFASDESQANRVELRLLDARGQTIDRIPLANQVDLLRRAGR